MAKSKALGGLFHNKLGRNQFLHDRDKLLLIMPGKLLEKGKIKMPSGNSSQSEDLPGSLIQACHAALYRILHAARNGDFTPRSAIPIALHVVNITGSFERADNFFDKKRVPLGQRIQYVQQFTMQKAAHFNSSMLLFKDGREHRINLIA